MLGRAGRSARLPSMSVLSAQAWGSPRRSSGVLMRSARVSMSVLAAGVLVLTGCSGEAEPAASPSATPSATETAAEEKASPEPKDTTAATAPAGQRFPQCEPAEGKTVTMLDNEVIEAQEIPEVVVEAFELGGETIPAQVIESVTVPERVIDRGCIVE